MNTLSIDIVQFFEYKTYKVRALTPFKKRFKNKKEARTCHTSVVSSHFLTVNFTKEKKNENNFAHHNLRKALCTA